MKHRLYIDSALTDVPIANRLRLYKINLECDREEIHSWLQSALQGWLSPIGLLQDTGVYYRYGDIHHLWCGCLQEVFWFQLATPSLQGRLGDILAQQERTPLTDSFLFSLSPRAEGDQLL